MAIMEKATNQKVIFAMNSEITTDTDTYSEIIDTVDYDNGVYFAFCLAEFDNTAVDVTFVIQDGDDAAMTDAADVAANKLVYGTAVVLTAANVVGANLYKEAVFSTKRYLRVTVTTLGIDVSVRAIVLAIVNPESLPTNQV